MTTFLVSNGTNPNVLAKLNPLPKQLYISIVAPNKKIYDKICSPVISNGWDKIIKTLELLPSLDTRIVIRHTLVKGWNMDYKYINQYEKLDEICPHCPGRRAMASKATADVETQAVLDDGTRIYVRNRAIPFFGQDGQVKGFIEMVENIDERKKMEKALQKSEVFCMSLICS